VHVAVRVGSSGIKNGLGMGVVGSEKEGSGGRCGGRGRPKAAGVLILDEAFGGNCGTAIGVDSGWTGDELAWCPGPGVGGEKEVGSGGRCAGAEQAGHGCFLGGGFGENCVMSRLIQEKAERRPLAGREQRPTHGVGSPSWGPLLSRLGQEEERGDAEVATPQRPVPVVGVSRDCRCDRSALIDKTHRLYGPLRAGAPESGWAADRAWAWCWRRGASEKDVGAGAQAGAAEGRDIFGLGAVVGTAAPQSQSGWAADGPGMSLVPWSWRRRREKEVGVGAQVRSAQAGHDCFLGGGFGGNVGTARGSTGIGMGSGSGMDLVLV
jgi:hypothetical protein